MARKKKTMSPEDKLMTAIYGKPISEIKEDERITILNNALSPFERAVGAEIFDTPFNEEQIPVVKQEAAKLFSIAEQTFYEDALPKWKKVKETFIRFNSCKVLVRHKDGTHSISDFARYGEYYLYFTDLDYFDKEN